ncbi:hypothetical protein J6590_036599 [Homalodisca vitripennis]|nr:hypothetical protein J6590_036599 [Homalodisca vitripennis]
MVLLCLPIVGSGSLLISLQLQTDLSRTVPFLFVLETAKEKFVDLRDRHVGFGMYNMATRRQDLHRIGSGYVRVYPLHAPGQFGNFKVVSKKFQKHTA